MRLKRYVGHHYFNVPHTTVNTLLLDKTGLAGGAIV
ncbi:MAG: hypothetical protein K0R82_146 [Flavipsychrobacter sp.]|jgi:hypothetical protein|nr:hypothetical protein [Flavipsychrobacter sp.]